MKNRHRDPEESAPNFNNCTEVKGVPSVSPLLPWSYKVSIDLLFKDDNNAKDNLVSVIAESNNFEELRKLQETKCIHNLHHITSNKYTFSTTKAYLEELSAKDFIQCLEGDRSVYSLKNP